MTYSGSIMLIYHASSRWSTAELRPHVKVKAWNIAIRNIIKCRALYRRIRSKILTDILSLIISLYVTLRSALFILILHICIAIFCKNNKKCFALFIWWCFMTDTEDGILNMFTALLIWISSGPGHTYYANQRKLSDGQPNNVFGVHQDWHFFRHR